MAKFKVVNIDSKITKAIGKKQNLLGLSDKNDTVIFIKNKFDYSKTSEKSIIKRLNTDLDIGKELKNFKDDLVLSLTDINAAHVANGVLPTVDTKVLNGLKDLQYSLKSDKKTKFYLERISDTQKKIYKVLSRIQEDLIDEQDTRIKEKKAEPKLQSGTSVMYQSAPEKAQPASDSRVLSKITSLLKRTSVKDAVKIAGKVLKVAEVILLLYYIVKNYNLAEKSIDEPGIIEKIIFALFAGVTEWVGLHIDMLSWLVDNFIAICNWIKDHIEEYSQYLGGFEYLAKGVAYAIEYAPLKIICEYCLKPVFDWLKQYGQYGAPVGVYAVSAYRSYKDNITNAIPNGKTFKLMFGETKIDDARKINVYNWDVVGKSQIRGSSKDLAKILTSSELKEILEHNDIDEYDIQKVKQALALKESEHISDEEVMARRNEDVGLRNMIDSLTNNIGFFDNAKEWKKLWLALAQNSLEFVKVNPEATVITYYTSNGKPSTLNVNHLLLDNPYFTVSNSTEAPEALCKGIVSELKIAFAPESDIFWFTPFGTVVIQETLRDPILSKKLIDRNMVKNYKLIRGSLGIVYRVIGFFDTNFRFYRNVFNPIDIVFKKIFKYNIITESNLRHLNQAKITKNLNDVYEEEKTSKFKRLPSNLPSYVSNSYNQSYDDFINTLPKPQINPSDTKKKVWDFFKNEFGMSDYQIAGIMGNLDVESRGFDSDVIQSEHMDRSKSGRNDGMSGGLCQWHDVGNSGRLTNLKNFAKGLGRDWRDLDVQLQFLKYELTTSYKGALKAILDSKNVHDAAKAWVYHYEKPANKEHESRKRASIGAGYLDLYSETTPQVQADQEFRIPMRPPENPNDVNDNTTGQGSDVLALSRQLIQGTTYSQGLRTKDGFYDCSSFVADVLKNAGFNIRGVPTTDVFGNELKRVGFSNVGSATALNQSGVKPGDILLKPGKHIMIYNGNGEVVEANGWNDKNHNGVNRWGALHKMSDVYQVWRIPGMSAGVSAYASNTLPKQTVESVSSNAVETKTSTDSVGNNISNNMLIANTDEKDYEYEGMCEELFNIKIVNV